MSNMGTTDPTINLAARTALSGGGYPITNAGGPSMTPQPPSADPISSAASTAATTAPEHAGFFSRLGSALKQAAPYIQPALAHVAAAFGNRAPLQDYEQQTQLHTQNALAQSREQDTEATNALHRQALQQGIDNYQTPAQVADTAVNTHLRETPQHYMTPSGDLGVGLYDPASKSYHSATVTDAAGQGQPMTMPAPVGPHITGTDANGQPIVEFFSKYTKPGTQAAPTPSSSGLLPGVGKVNPMDLGASGTPQPDPSQFPGGKNSPEFKQAYQGWLRVAAREKLKNQEAVAGVRAREMNETRPLPSLNGEGENVYTTIRDQRSQNPGQPIKTASQTGALGVAGKAATTSEIDTNLQAVNNALNDVTKLNNGGFGDLPHRTAFAAALSPSNARGGVLNEIPGVSLANAAVEAAGQNALQPAEKNLVSTLRNLKQGAVSFKNILSANGVSDAQVSKLDAELPSEADIIGGDPNYVRQKLQNFERIFRSVVSQYPQYVNKAQGKRSVFGAQPTQSPAAPPTMPPVNARAPKWNPTTLRYE